jgi:N utilization substance protein A
MSIIHLPNLKELIDEISRTHNLPKADLQEALREALLKGYEKHRRARELNNPAFTDDPPAPAPPWPAPASS